MTSMLVLSSEWLEGFSMVVHEAFAFGTPAAVSNLGPLPGNVMQGMSGVVFEVGNPASHFHEVPRAWSTPDLLPMLGKGPAGQL